MKRIVTRLTKTGAVIASGAYVALMAVFLTGEADNRGVFDNLKRRWYKFSGECLNIMRSFAVGDSFL